MHDLKPRRGVLLALALSAAEVDAQPFYVVNIPGITRALIVVGITCAIGVTACGTVLFSLILIKYGW